MIKTVLLIVLVSPWMVLDAAELYRYYNQQGVLVTTDTPPADAAIQDYQVVNEAGRLLRIVSTTDRTEVLPRYQTKQDNYLRTSFSNISDIQSLKIRKVQLLVREVELLENNLTALTANENKMYFDASNIELIGDVVPKSMIEQLQRLKGDRVELIDRLAQRRQERKALERRYEGYIARYQELQKSSK